MAKILLIYGVVLLVFTAPVLVTGEELKVKGELVEVSCFKKLGAGKALDPSHLSCATECAKKGSELGIFNEDEGLYRIAGDYATKQRAKLIELLGKQVQATGSRVRGEDYRPIIDVATIVPVKKN